MDRLLNSLLQKYIDGSLSVEEAQTLLEQLNNPEQKNLIDELLYSHFINTPVTNTNNAIFQTIQKNIADRIGSTPKPAKLIRKYISIAAACAAIIVLGIIFYKRTQPPSSTNELVMRSNDILPGCKGGVVTIDGKSVLLDAKTNMNKLPVDGSKKITFNNGVLKYNTQGLEQMPTKNLVATPKGHELKLVLPDGSQVWLNAGSTLKFPTTFDKMERLVELSGEAFFDVAHNGQWPFIVKIINSKIPNAQIKVTGTRFNVNAYANNNAIETTLIEGSVDITSNNKAQKLLPGQQVIIPVLTQQISKPVAVETDIVSSWKDGYFKFENEPLSEILKQLERWYDITVEYNQSVPSKNFTGTLSRSLSLRNILLTFKSLGINYTIEARTLHITK